MKEDTTEQKVIGIKNLVKESNLKKAFENLYPLVIKAGQRNLEKNYIILSQDYRDLKTDKLRNVISDEVFQVRENKLIQSLLELVDEIEGPPINYNSQSTEMNEQAIADNRGCLVALTNPKLKITFQLLLMAVGLIFGGKSLLNFFTNPTPIKSEEKSVDIQVAQKESTKESMELFLASKNNDVSRVFYSNEKLIGKDIVDLLIKYPSSTVEFINYTGENLEKELEEILSNSTITPSRLIYEEANAFSAIYKYEIIINR